MTVDQIRSELDMAEALYSKWTEQNHLDRANLASKAIDRLQEMMIAAIMAEDPYTTAADIRYFENFR
jgi:hypothetical protein